jgi:uncharacterized membrane protein YfhO
VPKNIKHEPTAERMLAEMGKASDFSQTVWVEEIPRLSSLTEANGGASVAVRAVGPDLLVSADARTRALVATSIPAWPGWRAESGGHELATVLVNHAFVGFVVPAGRSLVRLHYRPFSFELGLWAFLFGVAVIAMMWLVSLRRRPAAPPRFK